MDEVAAGRSPDGMPLMNAPSYSQAMLQKFFQYWTECNHNGRKMRFEMEKVFEMARRLATWKAKEEEFSRQRATSRSSMLYNSSALKPSGYEPSRHPNGYGTL